MAGVSVDSFYSDEDGVERLDFAARRVNDRVEILAHMIPGGEVGDASEEDFPLFDATVSIDSFKQIVDMFNDAWKEISNG